jgi:hypothetical protein
VINLSMTGPANDFELYLYDPSQTLVRSSLGAGSTESITYTAGTTGTHYARVDGAAGTFNATTPYALTISVSDALTVSPASVSQSAPEGSTTPVATGLTLGGTSPLAWTAATTQNAPWLGLSATSGTTPSTLTLTLDPTGLTPGTYRDTVVVTAAGALGSPDSTPVTFTITCTDAYEPNGSFGTASPLTSGVSVVAKLCTTTDDDYYAISVIAGQTINLALTPPPAFLYDAVLYSPAQNFILRLSSNGNPVQTSHVAAFTGTYYVLVERLTGSVSTTQAYTLTVTLQDALTVSPASVSQSAPEGSTTPVTSDLTLTGTNPIGWTAATTQGAAWLSLGATSGTTPGTLTLTLDPSGLAIGTYRDTVVVTATGAVGSPDSTPVILTITCTDSFESNDSFATASPITSGTPVMAKICSSSDVDYFSFAANAGQSITVTLTPPATEDYHFTLYDPAQGQIIDVHSGGAAVSTTQTAGSTGSFYVRVYGFSSFDFSATVPYTLTVTVQ